MNELKSRPAAFRFVALAGALLLASGCVVGPRYHQPTAPVPPAYKETGPPAGAATNGWQPAQPNDGTPRGSWWEVYGDPQLNALEEQVSISNQNVLAAAAQFEEAKQAVRVARSGLFPTLSTAPSITASRTSATLFNVQAGNLTSGERQTYDLPVDLSYTADIWGSIRHSVRGSEATAQASFADLENARLSYQAQLAEAYFELHGVDADQELLTNAVKLYEDYLQLTQYRFDAGVASEADVAQARTLLDTTRAQLIDEGVARAQYEHAIAVLSGKPPARLTLPSAPLKSPPPPIPAGVPSTLLERRPDIAAAERQVAAANEQIGIAKAALYPALTLTGSAGLESGSIAKWLTLPSRFWSVGPQLAETLFDAGRRRAIAREDQAAYDATVANYRQTVLTAFQQVEDNLAASRVLAEEAQAEARAIEDAQHSLDVATYQYKAGTVSYLNVITAQTALLQNQIQSIGILSRRMTASVLLIEALGGGWSASSMPTPNELLHPNTPLPSSSPSER